MSGLCVGQVWMCGGQILIVTCSRVGHVFRKTSPYSWPGGVARIINHNTQRIVEVWMDDYKDFFYKINPGETNHCSSLLNFPTMVPDTVFSYLVTYSIDGV